MPAGVLFLFVTALLRGCFVFWFFGCAPALVWRALSQPRR
jgi:hypothetical protein